MNSSIEAKLSERKTVHEWLNANGIPSNELGKPICLLRRLRIALDQLAEMKADKRRLDWIEEHVNAFEIRFRKTERTCDSINSESGVVIRHVIDAAIPTTITP